MSDVETVRPEKGRSRRRRILTRVAIGFLVLALVVVGFLVFTYNKLENNINAIAPDLGDNRPAQVEVEGPEEPLNVLVMAPTTAAAPTSAARRPGCPTPRCCCTSRPTGGAPTASACRAT